MFLQSDSAKSISKILSVPDRIVGHPIPDPVVLHKTAHPNVEKTWKNDEKWPGIGRWMLDVSWKNALLCHLFALSNFSKLANLEAIPAFHV